MIYVGVRAFIQPELAPGLEKPSIKKMVLSIKDILPIILVMFAVLGTIYLGIATPTEAAALGASLALILTIVYKKMDRFVLKNSLISAVEISLYLMVIVIGAYILSMAFSMERIPAALAQTIGDLDVNRYVIWAILVIMYMIIGMFIDGISIILLTVPVVHPVMMQLGFDSIWLGVVLTVCIEMGQITPPVGVNLFVIYGLVNRDFKDIVYGTLPFMFLQVLAVIILTIFPFLVTWLPDRVLTVF
jgi:tripartite ATP-independent transporter DctM subunit